MDGSVILIHAPVDAPVAEPLSPPMGLLYLGAVLRQYGIPTQLWDLHYNAASWDGVEQAVSKAKHCLVGFGCDSENFHRVLHLSDRLLSRFTDLTIVLGGPHVTHVWEPYVTDQRLVVRGEGEYPLLLLAKHFLRGEGTLAEIPGIVYSQDGILHTNPPSLGPYEDVNSIPFPDISLLPTKESYSVRVITARGCPYQCFFCSEGNENRGYRPRTAENVEAELASLKTYYEGRIPYLGFADDTFTVSAQRVHEMCDVIDRVFTDKSCFGFFCEGRVNVLAEHPELIYRLKEAGLLRLQIGVESGDQNMLDRLNKKIRVEQIEKVVATCNEANVPSIFGNFMCGLPGQTEQDLEREIGFAEHLVDLAPRSMEISMSILVPYPGTELRMNAPKWGLSILDEDFVTGKMSTDGCFAATSSLSKEQIVRFCARFKSELETYMLEKAASCLSPHNIKELFVHSADRSVHTFLVKKLSQIDHMNFLLHLRRRKDHRFLFEIPDGLMPTCSPLSIIHNTITRSNGSFVINERSAMDFELTQDEMRYYEYFCGKLSFEEIAQRVTVQPGVAEEQALKECLEVYMKCEDKLAAIILI